MPFVLPGDYNIRNVAITSFDRQTTIDIRDLIKQIDIYQSIFDPSYTVELYVSDGVGLAESLPIVGEEAITLDITTPGSTNNQDMFKTTTLTPYKISNRVNTNNRAQMYIIHATPATTLTGLTKTISKTYEGLVSDIVKRIYSETFQQTNTLETTQTINNVRLVVPTLNTWQAINLASHYCVTSETIADVFLFFQNHFGIHRLISLKSAISAPSVAIYTYGVLNNTVNDSTAQTNINTLKVLHDFDTLDALSNGMLGGETISYDTVTKRMIRKVTKYSETFRDTQYPHVTRNRLFSGATDATADPTNVGHFVFSNDDRKQSSFVKAKGGRCDLTYSDGLRYTYGERASIKQQFNQSKVTLEVPGDLTLAAGQMIEIVIPSADATLNAIDRYTSGRYLISACRHSFSVGSKFTTSLEVIRDSRAIEVKTNVE